MSACRIESSSTSGSTSATAATSGDEFPLDIEGDAIGDEALAWRIVEDPRPLMV